MRFLYGITDLIDMSLSNLQKEFVMDRETWHAWSHQELDTTEHLS